MTFKNNRIIFSKQDGQPAKAIIYKDKNTPMCKVYEMTPELHGHQIPYAVCIDQQTAMIEAAELMLNS